MVHGVVRGLLRLGYGAERLWDESARRWRTYHNKTIFERLELHSQNEQLHKRGLVPNLGWSLLAIYARESEFFRKESSYERDDEATGQDGEQARFAFAQCRIISSVPRFPIRSLDG